MNKILAIDDEEPIRRRLEKLLTFDGYEVFTAENGKQGLEIFQKLKEKQNHIKVVLVDLKMPGIDGIEVLKRIKESLPQTEVIIITGHGAIKSAIQALKMGAFGYITKPIEYDELLLDISRALEKQELQRRSDEYLMELIQTKAWLENLVNTVPESLVVINRDLKIKRANRTFYATFQIEQEKVMGSSLCDILQDKDGKLRSELIRIFGTGDMLKDFEMSYQSEELDERVFNIIAKEKLSAEEEKEELVVIQDISERKQAEEKYRSLVESTDDSIYLVDRNFKYLFMNRKHISKMGLSGNEYLGRAYSEFHSPDKTKWFIEKVTDVFNTGESVRHGHKSPGDGKYYLLTLSPVKKSDGTVISVTVVSKDITELKSMEEKLYILSFTDELTGLYNRRGFFTLAEQQLKIARRQEKEILMLYVDLDDLKMINDKFGHHEGDRALTYTGNILKETFRESDIIARISGDEFLVLFTEDIKISSEELADRLQVNLRAHNEKETRRYKLSLSLGIAYYNPEHPCSIGELLRQADASMYEQKRYKKNS